MKSANNPKNETTSTLAQGSGQISIKTLLNRIAEERNWIEHEGTACAEQELYYAGQLDMLDRITVFLMARSNQAPNDGVLTTDF